MLPKICSYDPLPDDNANKKIKTTLKMLENQATENWTVFFC